MPPRTARQWFTEFVAAMNTLDFAELEKLVDPEFVGDYPQSGERCRGFAAFRAQIERYPGGLPASAADMREAQVVGDDERWVITPGYTVLPLAGPERYTTVVRTRYPDGSEWYIVAIVELRDGRMIRSTTYFAPEFEPPEWRRDIVEIVPRSERAQPA